MARMDKIKKEMKKEDVIVNTILVIGLMISALVLH